MIPQACQCHPAPFILGSKDISAISSHLCASTANMLIPRHTQHMWFREAVDWCISYQIGAWHLLVAGPAGQ